MMNSEPMDAEAILRHARHRLIWVKNLKDSIDATILDKPISFYITIGTLYFVCSFSFFLWFFRKAPNSKLTSYFRDKYRTWALVLRKRRSQGPKPTRFFQMIALSLLLGGWIISIFCLLPIVTSTPGISSIHIFIINFGFFTSLATFKLACTVEAGTITELTMLKFDNYAYDNVLFVPDRICPTAKIRKLARSKYCRMSQRHVPRFDHYCIWLNQAVGEENHRYFYMFVMSTAILSCYGIYFLTVVFGILLKESAHEWLRPGKLWVEELSSLGSTILYSKDYTWKDMLSWNWRMILVSTSFFLLEGFMDLIQILGIEFQTNPKLSYLAFLYLICFWITPALTLLGMVHTVLICKNMTTNEASKWKNVRQLYWKAKKRHNVAMKERKIKGIENSNAETSNSTNDKASTCSDTDTKLEQKEITIDEAEKDVTLNYLEKLSDMNDYSDPGLLPKGIYNLGIINNIYEVFYPRSERKEVTVKWVTFLLEEDKRRKQMVNTNAKKEE